MVKTLSAPPLSGHNPKPLKVKTLSAHLNGQNPNCPPKILSTHLSGQNPKCPP